MQIDKTIKFLAAAILLLTFAYAPADPASDESEGESDRTAQPSSETSTTEPGRRSAEAGDIKPFVPSEAISPDSAVAFPVDI